MRFEENKSYERLGEKIGFLFSFLMLSSILYLVLLFFGKINSGISYIYILLVVVLIVIIGKGIKRWLG